MAKQGREGHQFIQEHVRRVKEKCFYEEKIKRVLDIFEWPEMRQGTDNVNAELRISTKQKQQIKWKGEKIEIIVNSRENKKFCVEKR